MNIEQLDQAVFVPVHSDSGVRFDERVSIGVILGKFMSQMGYNLNFKELIISKEKGDQNYGKERKETKRSQSKEKES